MEKYKDEQLLKFISKYENSQIDDLCILIEDKIQRKSFVEKTIIMMHHYNTLKGYIETLENNVNSLKKIQDEK